MKKTFFLGIALCLAIVANAQQSMEWYTYWGSNVGGNQIEPQRMVVDNEGNIYVAALFGGDKVAVEGKTLVSNSSTDKGDAVIVKMSPSKMVLWTYPIAASGNATISDIAIDRKGNVVATGAFTKSINAGEAPMALDDTNMGEAAIYVLKLSAAGEAINAWQIPALGAKAGSIVVDKKNSIIVAGLLDGDATFEEGGDPEGDFNNSAQLFIAKYNSKGKLMWHQFRDDQGNSTYSRPYLAVDAENNVYLAAGINGKTTLAGTAVNTTVSNAFLMKYDAAGNEKWVHIFKGSESDEAGGVAVSPLGQVAIEVNHHSGELRIDDMTDVFKHEYAFDPGFAHSAFFAFDLAGEFQWFYDWGYSNGTEGSDAITYGFRCSDEGVWYAAGMMTGRYGGSRLPEEERTIPAGKNSGIETVDNQWLQHNTNGGHDCYLLTLTKSGKLANVVRPGGPQYEDGIDVALSPDKKSIYFLQAINVRDKEPYTCPDNIFDSWTDINTNNRKGKYTVLDVFCPEAGVENPYTTAFKGIFNSSLLVKYSLPELNPNKLPFFEVAKEYNQTVAIVNPKGDATIFALETSGDVTFDGEKISGTFENDKDRFVGILAIDSIALPGPITYYGYDSDTKKSIRSNPRTVRYMPLTIDKPAEEIIDEGDEDQEGIENIMLDCVKGSKFMHDGVLYIERNGRIYNAQGAQVK